MKHAVVHAPAFSALRLDFEPGESILAQPGSMQAMTPGFDVEVKMGMQMSGKRGLLGGMRSMFGGESLFTVSYRSKRDGQHLMLAPEQMGEIRVLEVAADAGLVLARGAFLAATPTLSFALQYGGIHGMLATRGLFFLRTEGAGTLFMSSYGGLVEQTLGPDERYVLDNRNIVCFSQGMTFESVVLTKSLKSSFFSGEGFIVRFNGPGRLIWQTRARPAVGWLRGLLQTIT
jgi:uncharacterized protein (TIGR00266 family)